MMDLERRAHRQWSDARLRPVGEGDWRKEPFDEWWARNWQRLANLGPVVSEQWIYRHWSHSPFSFLPLSKLSVDCVQMTTDEILTSIHREFGGTLHPEFDYGVFQRRPGERQHPTSAALDQGTWDYPIVVLATPDGVVGRGGAMPEVRLALIEGHQRFRYLNALNERGRSTGPHYVFILTLAED